MTPDGSREQVVIIGGGPGGYEAALVASQLGAHVTLVEEQGLGGSCVLTDCVPSKALLAFGQQVRGRGDVDLPAVCADVLHLAAEQSQSIGRRLERAGVEVIVGRACLAGPAVVAVEYASGGTRMLSGSVVLLATGARPRVVSSLQPDGRRILNFRQLYALECNPEHVVVVGSGVTGIELAAALLDLGCAVTVVSSRDRVLPSADPDAAQLLTDVLLARGLRLAPGRAASAAASDSGAEVTLVDGTVLSGSHVLLAMGAEPSTSGLRLAESGVACDEQGFVRVDAMSRTSVAGVYAAGDCTGVGMLASVAAMQGRTAMWHALGQAVAPLRLETVPSAVFTDPEVASVGLAPHLADPAQTRTAVVSMSGNARARMDVAADGFVKLVARRGSTTILGGVIVGFRASELIAPVALAVQHGLTADQLAHSVSVYPSLQGSVLEAARLIMSHGD